MASIDYCVGRRPRPEKRALACGAGQPPPPTFAAGGGKQVSDEGKYGKIVPPSVEMKAAARNQQPIQ